MIYIYIMIAIISAPYLHPLCLYMELPLLFKKFNSWKQYIDIPRMSVPAPLGALIHSLVVLFSFFGGA